MASYRCILARSGARTWCLALWTAQHCDAFAGSGLHRDAMPHLPANNSQHLLMYGPSIWFSVPALQIVSQENKLRAAGHHRGLTQAGSQPTAGRSQVPADRFLQLKPGQHVTVDLPLDSHALGRQAEASSGSRARFSAAAVDLKGQAAAKAATECAVFLVPQVRPWETAKGTAFWPDDTYYPCLSNQKFRSAEGQGPSANGTSMINQWN